MKNIPKHIAIIPDGNRRWARDRGYAIFKGHEKSCKLENVKILLDGAKDLDIEYISIWGFSTENWKRSLFEKKFLFELLSTFFDSFESYAIGAGLRFRHIGRKDRLPGSIVKKLITLENKTSGNEGLGLNFFLDYGGRDEILRAIGRLLNEDKKEISESEFFDYLDTKGLSEPDLIIRTGGEKRLSGLMPFQATYSELYFLNKYFPDFSVKDLKDAVKDYSKRKRRFGGS